MLKIIRKNPWSRRLIYRLNFIRRLFLSPYIKFSFIPFRSIISFLNSTSDKFENVMLTDTGVFMLFYPKYVVKIPLGPIPMQDLKRNMDQYRLIKASEYQAFVNYWLEDHITFFKMELLKEGKNKQILANKYFNTISDKRFSSISSQNDIYELILQGHKKFINITHIQLSFDKNKKYPISIMHGDLTPRNIMTNSSNNPLLIDLNRFIFEGFKFIDLIHFEVEFKSKEIHKNYFDFITQNFNSLLKTYGSEALKIYVLYRVGSEHNDGVKNEGWYYDGMLALAQKLITLDLEDKTVINEK